jgi:general secretion pathway protein N
MLVGHILLLGLALAAPALLFLGLALATPASVAPIDPGPPSPNLNEATEAGNPLAKIPLSAITATRDRPLFSVSRRPPAPAIEGNAQPAQAPAATAPAPPERPAVKLIGTILSPATSVVLLRDSATQAVTRLHVGEATSGWRVKTISFSSVTLEKGEQSAVLGLSQPRDAPGEQTVLNSPRPEGS